MLQELEQQERDLTFKCFSNNLALEIGYDLAIQAVKCQLPIMIEINIANQTIFHYANDNAPRYNRSWLEKKRNSVYFFGHSTLWVSYKLNQDAEQLFKKYHLPTNEYAAAGGGFPINCDNVGLVGSICVSGLSADQDHQMIVETLKKYINN